MNTDLSVIIPCLNEQESLPALLEDLNNQQGIRFEIIIADGGSSDNTLRLVDNFIRQSHFPIRLSNSSKGRAIQMNHGVKSAKSNDLLFLHADSRLKDSSLLATAQECMSGFRQEFRVSHKSNNLAGHFGLKFLRSNNDNPNAYYFYESKTRLNRLDSINGDQGL